MPDRGKPDLVLALALDPPRGHQRQRAGQGIRGLARQPRLRARHRVPHARGPDGQEAARAQARRACIPTTSSGSSSAASARRSRSSAPSGSSRAPACCTTPVRKADGHRGSGSAAPDSRPREGGALAPREPGGALDLRRRAAALRPARRQPRVLRGPRLVGLRHHLLLGPAGAAAAARAAGDRAAASACSAGRSSRARTWCSSPRSWR